MKKILRWLVDKDILFPLIMIIIVLAMVFIFAGTGIFEALIYFLIVLLGGVVGLVITWLVSLFCEFIEEILK